MDHAEEIQSALHKIPWFNVLTPEHFQKTSRNCPFAPCKSGRNFFREGDTQDYVYIVLEGRVSLDIFVPHHGKVRFYTAEPMMFLAGRASRLVYASAQPVRWRCWIDGGVHGCRETAQPG